jgi:hypothetical protein
MVRNPATMKRRMDVLTLWRSPGKKSIRGIADQLSANPSTVYYIIKTWGQAPPMACADSPRKGRPPCYTARCASCSVFPLSHRYKRQIVRMALKHPFWSTNTLICKYHKHRMESHLQRPAGAVVKARSVALHFRVLQGSSKSL